MVVRYLIRQLQIITMQFNVTSVTFGSISNAIKSIYQHNDTFNNVYYVWYWIKWFKDIPFSNFSKNDLYETKNGKKKFKALTRKQNFQNQDIIEKLNNTKDEKKLKSYQINSFNQMNSHLYLKTKNLSVFNLNISLLPFHFEEFSTLLSTNKLPFDLLGITESRLKINKLPLNLVQLPDYNFVKEELQYTLKNFKLQTKKRLTLGHVKLIFCLA